MQLKYGFLKGFAGVNEVFVDSTKGYTLLPFQFHSRARDRDINGILIIIALLTLLTKRVLGSLLHVKY